MPRNPLNKYYEIDRENVPKTAPKGTRTHVPVPHEFVLGHVENAIYAGGGRILDGKYYLSHGGDRFIAHLTVLTIEAYEAAQAHGGWNEKDAMTVGIINSHDKSYAARILGGAILGKNITYLYQQTVARKHTTFIERDYPAKVALATEKIMAMRADINARLDCYAAYQFNDIFMYDGIAKRVAKGKQLVNDAVIELMKKGAYAPSGIPAVLKNFDEVVVGYVDRTGFAPELTAHMLFEAVTTYQNSEKNPFTLPERSQALFGVLDQITGAEKAILERVLDVIAK